MKVRGGSGGDASGRGSGIYGILQRFMWSTTGMAAGLNAAQRGHERWAYVHCQEYVHTVYHYELNRAGLIASFLMQRKVQRCGVRRDDGRFCTFVIFMVVGSVTATARQIFDY